MSSFDVVIVGGAAHGASAAYHLAAAGFLGSVLLIEKDPTFARAATALSAGGIRQQFSTAVNIEASLYGIDFLRRAGDLLAVDGERPDVALREGGYLFLASPAGLDTLGRNHTLQTGLGADIAFLDPPALAAAFPWLATEGIAAGCYGRTGEGWFDGFALCQALRRKARTLGVTLRTAEAAAVTVDGGRAAGVRLADGTRIAAGTVVLAAGTATPRLAATAGVTIPVEARKRFVFTFACRTPLPRFPLLIDPTGVYVRPEGELFISGTSPPAGSDPPAADFDVEHALFEETIWPVIAARVPAFAEIRPGRAWAGHYDFNTLDQNAIVGPVAGVESLLVATGFSGHGLQQAPAVGRGLAELILHGRYTTLDLTPLGHGRIAAGRPLVEANVV
jgi:glycine/D-amino acid oxidase-like deaminating enzyme